MRENGQRFCQKEDGGVVVGNVGLMKMGIIRKGTEGAGETMHLNKNSVGLTLTKRPHRNGKWVGCLAEDRATSTAFGSGRI
jgi:hypothetical protein